MSTLQKITDIESKLQALESLVIDVPRLTQEITKVNENIAQVTQAIKDIVNAVNKKNSDFSQMDNVIMTKTLGMEESLTALTKTLAAVVSELSDTDTINQDNVMKRIQKSDENENKLKLEQLIQLQAIEEVDSISDQSIITASQSFTHQDSLVESVSDFKMIELSSPVIDETSKSSFLGKKKGDTVTVPFDGGTLDTLILNIYEYKKVVGNNI